MNEDRVIDFLSKRLSRRLMTRRPFESDPRLKMARLGDCVKQLLDKMQGTDHAYAEQVLADEINEVVERFCFQLNLHRWRPHLDSMHAQGDRQATTTAACACVGEVLDLFSAAGV